MVKPERSQDRDYRSDPGILHKKRFSSGRQQKQSDASAEPSQDVRDLFQVASNGSTSDSCIAIHSGFSISSRLRVAPSSQIRTVFPSTKCSVSTRVKCENFCNCLKLWNS